MKRNHSLLVIVLLSIVLQLAHAVDVTSTAFRCSACRAIADSLADRLLNEKPRNHLDVRHRLDKDGNRYGKVIEFSVSELRTIELLDTLCTDKVKTSYELAWSRQAVESLHARSDSDVYWAKKGSSKGEYKRDIVNHQAVEERRFLANFCDGFIEKYEDDIVAKIIRGGSVGIGEFEDLLCGEISKYCTEKAGEDPWLPIESEEPEEASNNDSSDDDAGSGDGQGTTSDGDYAHADL